jgi:sugar/nucleoside kinase (ribokinase family)
MYTGSPRETFRTAATRAAAAAALTCAHAGALGPTGDEVDKLLSIRLSSTTD